MWPKNILYIVSTLRRTGPTHQLLYIIKYLDRCQFKPQILTLSPEPQDSIANNFRNLQIPIHTLGLSRWKGILHGNRLFKKAMHGLSPSLLHTQGIRADNLALNYIHELPVVTTTRNDPHVDYPTKFGTFQGRLMAWNHIRTLRRTKYVVACGQSLSQKMTQYNIATHIIANGVDTDNFSPLVSSTARTSLRQSLGLPVSSLVFVSVGSLIPRKDPLCVIDAFCRVSLQNSILIILGEGPLEGKCRNALTNCSSIPEIYFPGQVSDVRPWLRSADALISGAWSEGLPNSVLEGMSCGLPVILSDIPSHREIIEATSHSCGKLFPPGNSDALASILRAFSSNHLEANIPRQTVLENFSAKGMASAYQTLYEKILST